VWRGNPAESVEHPFRLAEVGRAAWDAKWDLLLPVLVMTGLYGGSLTGLHMTLVEVAALTAFYAFATQTFVTRDLRFRRDALRVATECGALVGGVLGYRLAQELSAGPNLPIILGICGALLLGVMAWPLMKVPSWMSTSVNALPSAPPGKGVPGAAVAPPRNQGRNSGAQFTM
jgi:hypothetical protein